MNPITIRLTGADTRQISMPHMTGALNQLDAIGLHRVVRMPEEKQLYPGSVLGEQGKVGPLPVPAGSERGRDAGASRCHADFRGNRAVRMRESARITTASVTKVQVAVNATLIALEAWPRWAR